MSGRVPSYTCPQCREDGHDQEWCPGHEVEAMSPDFGRDELRDWALRKEHELVQQMRNPEDRVPYQHDRMVARYPGGTDARMALRDALGGFMTKTDGTTDMPWWLEANYRWWHAGPMGIKRGAEILPPSETGVIPLLDSTDREMVYVTSSREEAIVYATVAMGRSGKMPQLYEVSFGVEPIFDDTQPESQTSFRVPRATVRRIEAPSRAELTGAMVEIMEAEQSETEVKSIDSTVDMFTDDTPIEGQCDLENPESCEACD